MELIDTHAHLDDEQFAGDLDAVMDRARGVGVVAIVAVGTTLETSRRAVELARRHDLIHAAVGIHPNYALQAGPDDWPGIVELAGEPEVVAIGETGLDHFRRDTPFEVQVRYFERHLGLAQRRGLPVIVHCRDAEAEVLRCLDAAAREGFQGVMHSFSGRAATAARAIELGFYISLAGQITFGNRKFDALRELARLIPPARLLVETDSPYLAPEPHRGQRNEPAYVHHTIDRLAGILGKSANELAATTSANARALFSSMRFPGT